MDTGRAEGGYTLVEMMIVVALLGILGAVAIPAYQGYVKTGKEAEGKAGLSNIALLEEQYFAENRTYDTVLATIGYTPENPTHFNWTIAAGASGIATSFTATATGKAGTGLPTFTINEANAKTRDGAAGW